MVEPPDVDGGDLYFLGHPYVGQVELFQELQGKHRRFPLLREPVLLFHQFLQLGDHQAAGLLSDGDQFLPPVEVVGAEAGYVRHDEDVGEVPLLLRRPVAEEAHGLVHDLDDRRQLVFLVQGSAHVHGDDDVRPHCPRVRYREVPDDAAVHQEVAVDLDGREDGRYGHAGAHRLRQGPFLYHEGLAGHDVGADAAEGDGEPVEVADVLHVLRQARQHGGEPLPALEPGGEQDPLLGYLERGDVLVMVALFLDGGAAARYVVGEHGVPVHVQHQLLQHVRRVPGGVEASHDASHARAGDIVDLEARLFDDLEDADMGYTLGAAP